MNRLDLERLDRDALIERAEAAGVTRARILTRPELVDELLLRGAGEHAAKQRARGLFGVARDLLARVVERGLHLPDAAERIRTLGGPTIWRHGAPAALPTVTLAEIYAAQGHRERAIETLGGVLAREPEHAAARALLAQLTDEAYPSPPPRLPPEAEEVSSPEAREEASSTTETSDWVALESDTPREPSPRLDDGSTPGRSDVDECVAIPVGRETMYVYWELREETLDHLRAVERKGSITLRVVVVVPTWDGPRASTRDIEVDATIGALFVRDLPAQSVVRAAVGWRSGDAFMPVAHSPALETTAGGRSSLAADALVRWTPHGPRRLNAEDPDAASIDRALSRARREGEPRGEPPRASPG